jgi:DNA-binding IclR family transcriptional regulator
MTKPRAGIQSVEVGFALLDALATARAPMMLRDLAAAAGMNAAKAHRYLVSFQRLGLVLQDAQSTRYDLGPAALKLGLASLERMDAVQLARSCMDDLMAQIGQTLAIAVWGNHGPTIVHWQESPQTITVNLRLGDVMPLLTSATGRCFAAYASPTAIAPLLKAELQTLAHTPPSTSSDAPRTMAQAKTLLAQTRAQGLGRVSNTLLPGIAGFCAPVFDSNGHMVLGLVTLGSTASFDDRWDGAVAQHLRVAAQRLSKDLGYAR